MGAQNESKTRLLVSERLYSNSLHRTTKKIKSESNACLRCLKQWNACTRTLRIVRMALLAWLRAPRNAWLAHGECVQTSCTPFGLTHQTPVIGNQQSLRRATHGQSAERLGFEHGVFGSPNALPKQICLETGAKYHPAVE